MAQTIIASSRQRVGRLAPIAVFVAILLLVPAVFTRVPFFTMATAVQMVLLSIATIGLTLLLGYAGQISIGQAAFYGVGAYTSAILTTRYGISPLVAILVGAIIAGCAAYVIGGLILRVRGHYLALATIALGLVLGYVAKQLQFTGGAEGITDIPKLQLGTIRLDSDLRYYYFAAALLVIVMIFARNLARSTFGKSLQALRDSEVAAASCGVAVAARKRSVFVFAAVLGALAGSLYAYWVNFVDTSTLGLDLSIQILIMATIGGLRTVWGAPVGAFLVLTLSQAAKNIIPQIAPSAGGQFEIAVYGIALILVLLFLRDGVAGSVQSAASALVASLRRSRHDSGPADGGDKVESSGSQG